MSNLQGDILIMAMVVTIVVTSGLVLAPDVPDMHPTLEACEAELLRSESCKQVWVKS